MLLWEMKPNFVFVSPEMSGTNLLAEKFSFHYRKGRIRKKKKGHSKRAPQGIYKGKATRGRRNMGGDDEMERNESVKKGEKIYTSLNRSWRIFNKKKANENELYRAVYVRKETTPTESSLYTSFVSM